ncbi:MAG: DUF1501 domain-containing protein [Phycisphaerae bacterium]
MASCNECKTLNRRAFLRHGGLMLGGLALADPLLRNVAATYAQSAGGTGNLLVLCELAGGLDALSVLAPFRDPTYLSKRPNLALAETDVTPLPDHPEYGLNALFPFFSDLYQQGQLGVVQQVGYPNANGSHFESREVYRFGVRNLASSVGVSAPWYERLRKTYFNEPFGVLDTQTIGDPRNFGYPDTTFRKAAQDAFGRLARMKTGRNEIQTGVLDTYKRIDENGAQIRTRSEAFTSTGSARGEFFRAATLASTGLGTRVLKLRYGGFDTHGSQAAANARLFPKINDEFQQFVDDLKAMGVWDRTCVLFFSEFGRRNAENGSPGTDHGHAGHMILAGPRVNGGLHGQNVTTADLNERSLPFYLDFRAVFGATIRDWLGFDPGPIFRLDGETFDENLGSALFV